MLAHVANCWCWSRRRKSDPPSFDEDVTQRCEHTLRGRSRFVKVHLAFTVNNDESVSHHTFHIVEEILSVSQLAGSSAMLLISCLAFPFSHYFHLLVYSLTVFTALKIPWETVWKSAAPSSFSDAVTSPPFFHVQLQCGRLESLSSRWISDAVGRLGSDHHHFLLVFGIKPLCLFQ